MIEWIRIGLDNITALHGWELNGDLPGSSVIHMCCQPLGEAWLCQAVPFRGRQVRHPKLHLAGRGAADTPALMMD